MGHAAVAYKADFQTVFYGFPFEAIPNLDDRVDVLSATLDFFGGCTQEEGWLKGQVIDALTNNPLEGALVDTEPNAGYDVTNPSGHYSLTLPAGTYQVGVSKEDYQPQTTPGIIVEAGLTTTLDFSLMPFITPAIVISPTSFSVTLAPNQVHTTSLNLSNEGTGALYFTLTQIPPVAWLTEAPLTGTVAPSSSMAVSLRFDTSDMGPDPYSTTLQLHSNDPLEPQIDVPITLVVITSCEPISLAGFSWTPLTPTLGQTITFTASASGTAPITYTWSLGDGSPSAEGQVISHTFDLAGTFTVTLAATNPCGQETRTHRIKVSREWKVCLPLIVK
jgi:PKD repeat protein